MRNKRRKKVRFERNRKTLFMLCLLLNVTINLNELTGNCHFLFFSRSLFRMASAKSFFVFIYTCYRSSNKKIYSKTKNRKYFFPFLDYQQFFLLR